MANPFAGEVEVVLNGERRIAKLTLGALAELEAGLGTDSLLAMAGRFEARAFSVRDVLLVVAAGLRGGGWNGSPDDLGRADLGGGPIGAARIAAELLARAFTVPDG
ncbi:MAG: gene transfer agent family protein [Pseudomonadota bacterium]